MEKAPAADSSVCANDEPAKDGASTEASTATPSTNAAGSSAWRRVCQVAAGVCADTASGFQAMFRRSLLRTTVLLFLIWWATRVTPPSCEGGDGSSTLCRHAACKGQLARPCRQLLFWYPF